jgi:hypothetical protein
VWEEEKPAKEALAGEVGTTDGVCTYGVFKEPKKVQTIFNDKKFRMFFRPALPLL